MKLRADTLLIKTQFLILTGIVVAQVLGKDSIASALFTLTFVLTVCIWLAVAKTRINKINLLAILIVVVSCINVAINALLTNTIVSFSYIKKLIMFWSTILLIAAMSDYKPERTVAGFVFRLNTFLSFFLIAMYFAQNSQMHYWNNRITIYLTFRFTNPNLAAVFLSANCIIQMIDTYISTKWLSKIVHGGLSAILIGFILETRARNALLLLTCFIMVYFIMIIFPKRKWKLTNGMAFIIAIFPLVFVLGYLLLIYTPIVQKIFEFLVGSGKPLDARVEIWTEAIKTFATSPLVGAYSQISDGTGLSQLHNSHLDVMASYGAIVLILLCVFLTNTLRNTQSGIAGKMNFLCITGFAALLLSGIGEAMIFSGGLGIYIYSGILRMLANYDFEKRNY